MGVVIEESPSVLVALSAARVTKQVSINIRTVLPCRE